MVGARRITVSEYGPLQSISDHAATCGLSAFVFKGLLKRSAARITRLLNLRDCIEFSEDGFRPVKMAGMVSLGGGLELEIAPKFLESSDAGWRQDFFAVATLARFGRVLPAEALRAAAGGRDDLADLLGLAMVEMYERNRSRPLWTYQGRSWQAFEIDGEVEPEALIFSEADGFTQSGLVLDRQNRYNQLIHHAMDLLLPEIRNGELRRRLTVVKLHLSPQQTGARFFNANQRLPSRHRRWQDLHDLSASVAAGTGIGLHRTGGVLAPGYVIKTADAWESLVFRAVRTGLSECSVAKTKRRLGVYRRPSWEQADDSSCPNEVVESIMVAPDIIVEKPPAAPLLVDSKYRTLQARSLSELRVQASDLYEMLAFLKATGAERGVLIYPLPSSGGAAPQAGWSCVFEHLQVDRNQIFGLAIDVRGISASNGFERFTLGLCAALLSCWRK